MTTTTKTLWSAILLLRAQPTTPSAHGVSESDARLVERVVEGRSLEDNLLGETPDRKVLIYLPPGYGEKPRTRYPVVYLLGGLGGDHRNFTRNGTPNRLGLMRSPHVDVGLDFPFVYPEKVVAPKVLARWADADLLSQINRARTPVHLARGIGPTILHPEVGDIPLLRDALLANGIAHTFDELPGDHFNKNAGRGT